MKLELVRQLLPMQLLKHQEPVTEGYVGLMEPFIDTVVICTLTALVILTTVYDPAMANEGIQGLR